MIVWIDYVIAGLLVAILISLIEIRKELTRFNDSDN